MTGEYQQPLIASSSPPPEYNETENKSKYKSNILRIIWMFILLGGVIVACYMADQKYVPRTKWDNNVPCLITSNTIFNYYDNYYKIELELSRNNDIGFGYLPDYGYYNLSEAEYLVENNYKIGNYISGYHNSRTGKITLDWWEKNSITVEAEGAIAGCVIAAIFGILAALVNYENMN